MSPTKQFWTLAKFQFLLNPVMWFLPLIIGATTLIPFLISGNTTYHSSLSLYFFSNQNFFFVAIFGSMILAPDKFQLNNRMRGIMAYSGTEFLLTRAIDRPILYRAKAILLYILILLVPIGAMIYFLGTPDLIVHELSKIETQQVLDHVPGSVTSAPPAAGLQPNIIIPHGNALIAEWQLWTFLLAIIVLQLLISVLSPYKFGRMLFWSICYTGLLGPAFLPLFQISSKAHHISPLPETLFYFFVEHQPLIWAGTALTLMACHFFCEREFARQEH